MHSWATSLRFSMLVLAVTREIYVIKPTNGLWKMLFTGELNNCFLWPFTLSPSSLLRWLDANCSRDVDINELRWRGLTFWPLMIGINSLYMTKCFWPGATQLKMWQKGLYFVTMLQYQNVSQPLSRNGVGSQKLCFDCMHTDKRSKSDVLRTINDNVSLKRCVGVNYLKGH